MRAALVRAVATRAWEPLLTVLRSTVALTRAAGEERFLKRVTLRVDDVGVATQALKEGYAMGVLLETPERSLLSYGDEPFGADNGGHFAIELVKASGSNAGVSAGGVSLRHIQLLLAKPLRLSVLDTYKCEFLYTYGWLQTRTAFGLVVNSYVGRRRDPIEQVALTVRSFCHARATRADSTRRVTSESAHASAHARVIEHDRLTNPPAACCLCHRCVMCRRPRVRSPRSAWRPRLPSAAAPTSQARSIARRRPQAVFRCAGAATRTLPRCCCAPRTGSTASATARTSSRGCARWARTARRQPKTIEHSG